MRRHQFSPTRLGPSEEEQFRTACWLAEGGPVARRVLAIMAAGAPRPTLRHRAGWGAEVLRIRLRRWCRIIYLDICSVVRLAP